MVRSHAEGGLDHGTDLHDCFRVDWETFLHKYGADGALMVFLFRRKRGKTGYLNMHPGTRIPDALLMRPLDWEKAKWLYWLIHGGGRLSPLQSWEVGFPFSLLPRCFPRFLSEKCR
jgi:hypothetical protein